MIKKSFLLKSGFIIFLLVFTLNVFSKDYFAEIITKHTVTSEDLISIVVRVKNEDQSINTSINGSFQILSSPAILVDDIIKIDKGVGSLTTKICTNEDFIISIENFTGQKTIIFDNTIPISQIGGEIYLNSTWHSDSIIFINEDLTISQDAILTIEQGCRVFLGEKINIFVNGVLKIDGTSENPVFFQPLSPDKPWGGISISNNIEASNVDYGFFVKGGDNEEYIFGHSQSQPVIMVENSSLTLANSFVLDNPGKAIGGENGQIGIDKCVFSRCDTGGEYHFCLVNISGSYFIDMPNNDSIPADDDNDASYFNGLHPNVSQPSIIENSVFITGKDDGIDHNGANLEIKNCWIEGFDNEGIAASNTNNVFIYNTLVKNCEQGIEAGYGNPNVCVDHCTFVNNDVGLRFGDWYDWGCEGHITITNSILYGNVDNILNFDVLTQGPVQDAIDVSYSMTNDTEYDNYPNCMTGVPVFDENYLLLPESPGVGLATDGSNLGICIPNLSVYNIPAANIIDLQIRPNPFRCKNEISFTLEKNADVLIQVFDNYGNLIFRQSMYFLHPGQHIIPFQADSIKQGLYIFTLLINNKTLITIKAIAF